MVRPPDGGPARPPGRRLVGDGVLLVDPGHLWGLRLHGQGGRTKVGQRSHGQVTEKNLAIKGHYEICYGLDLGHVCYDGSKGVKLFVPAHNF